MSLLELYESVVQPFHTCIYEMERGGFRVDEAVRKQLVAETRKKLVVLEKEIKHEAAGYYESWMAELAGAGLGAGRLLCETHPEYRGATKRQKCVGCGAVYQQAMEERQFQRVALAEQRSRWGAGIRPGGFALRSDACWRRLLFDEAPLGLGLAASGRRKTAKRKLAQVDKDALAELSRAHPQIELLRLKVQFDSLEHDLSTYLKVVVDAAGYAHPCYHLMTSTGRLASGDDGFEPGRVRKSEAGNMQNVPDRLRRMYVPDDADSVLVQLDWRQVEALVTAWLAGETQMVEVILDGSRDIHTENALILAETVGVTLTPEQADEVPFPNDPGKRSFRQAGKLTHKLHYGMGADKFSRSYGIPRATCVRIIDAYFAKWRRLRAWQDSITAEAQAERKLTTPFGRELRFWNFDRRGKLGDREEALAFRPQSIVGDMVKVAGRQLYDRVLAYRRVSKTPLRLVTTTHDSWTLSCHEAMVEDVVHMAKEVMEQKWEQLERLWCPVDVAVGKCWRKFKPGECEGGLRKWAGAQHWANVLTAIGTG